MPKIQTISTNFTAGEFSPRLRGRVDVDKYNASAQLLSDVVVMREGGVTSRPSLDYMGEIKSSAVAGRIIPFVYSTDTSYLIELGVSVMRIWKSGALVLSGGSPVEVTTTYTEAELPFIDFTQSGDTMFLAHPAHPLARLRRFSDTRWVLDDLPVEPGAIAETGNTAAIQLTLSSATVGTGRTITAASSFFKPADVGRQVTYSGGIATITAYSSGTSVTATVVTAFASATLAASTWVLEGTPMTSLTPSAKEAVGRSISLVTGVDGFRSDDVGKYLSFSGGLVRVDSVNGVASATDTQNGDGSSILYAYTFLVLADTEMTVIVDSVTLALGTDYTVEGVGLTTGRQVRFTTAPAVGVNNVVFSRAQGYYAVGTIINELSSTVAAQADGWVALGPIWTVANGYPATVSLYQQRLWAGGTTRYPVSLWGSRSGQYANFAPGPDDDHAVYKTMDSDNATPIRYLVSQSDLMALTNAAEFAIRGGVEKPVTQSNASIKAWTRWGCDLVRPEDVGNNLLFVQRGGTVMRAVYPLQIEGFDAKDVSAFSSHLMAAGVECMSFQQKPEAVLWCATTLGGLIAVTYNAEQNVIAFARGATDGLVEWIVTIPEGSSDSTYMLVRRTIGGATKRYVERVNWTNYPGMDSRKAAGGASTVTWSGFDHLAGKTVAVLANSIYVGTKVVSAGGVITLDDAATAVEAGLPYTPTVTLQQPEIGTGTGTSQAQSASTHRVTVRLLETIGCAINGEEVPMEQFDIDPLDNTLSKFTGDKDVTDYGWDKGGAALTITQPRPYPFSLLAVIREFTVNAG